MCFKSDDNLGIQVKLKMSNRSQFCKKKSPIKSQEF